MLALKFGFPTILVMAATQAAAAMAADSGDPVTVSADAPNADGDRATVVAAPETPTGDNTAPSSAARGAVMQGMEMGRSGMGNEGLMPAGVMVGKAGEWMVGYSYSYERMDGNLVGSRSISDADVLRQFKATPTDMTMQMHMGSLMYAPTNRLTLMVMVPYLIRKMNHVDRAGERFQENPSGFGDIELTGLYSLYALAGRRHRLLLTLGASLPTGSINKRMMGMRIEYPMQLGSGTVAVRPGLIYLGQASPWGWGAKLGSTIQIGRNENQYRLGNRYEASAWVTRLLSSSMSVSAGVNGESRANISGFDPVLDMFDEPTKDPRRQGGERLDATLGVAFHPQGGVLSGNSFFLNADAPVLQSLDGPQLKKRFGLRFQVQRNF